MLRTASVLASLVAALTPGVAAAGPARDCDGVFLFGSKPRFSLNDAIRFGGLESVEAPGDRILAAETTNWEDFPTRGRWQALAIVYASEIDLGTTAIGGVLWTTHRGWFGTGGGMSFRKGKDDVYLTFKPIDPIEGKPCRMGYVFKLDNQGVLYAGGTRVGRTPTFP